MLSSVTKFASPGRNITNVKCYFCFSRIIFSLTNVGKKIWVKPRKCVGQPDLANLSLWIQSNGLALNIKKTEYMVVGSHQRLKLLPAIDLRLNNVSIAKVSTYKYLGVVLDSNISWSAHSDYICKKASSRIGLLTRTRPFISRSMG